MIKKISFFLIILSFFLFFVEHNFAKTTIIKPSYLKGSYTSNERSTNVLHDDLFSKKNSLYKKNIKTQTEQKKWTYIIAPHPDDEILCCAETISEKIKQDTPIKIVYVTNGDALSTENNTASYLYGERRKKESLKAIKKLGIHESNAVFLNFPDGELNRLNNKNTIFSRFTGKRKSGLKSFFPNSPYTLEGLEKNISDLFTIFPPKEIFLPSQKDTHSDHTVSGKIALNSLKNVEKNPDIFEYTIHGNTLKTTPINQWKKSLISLFVSQFHTNFHKKYLLDFAQKEEHFIQIQNFLVK